MGCLVDGWMGSSANLTCTWNWLNSLACNCPGDPRQLAGLAFVQEVGRGGGWKKEVQHWMERWVYGQGCPRIHAAFRFDKYGCGVLRCWVLRCCQHKQISIHTDMDIHTYSMCRHTSFAHTLHVHAYTRIYTPHTHVSPPSGAPACCKWPWVSTAAKPTAAQP